MKKQMVEFLKKNDLSDEEIYVKIEIASNSFEIENGTAEVEEPLWPFVTVTFQVDNFEQPIQIGEAIFRLVNSENNTATEIREIADSIDFSFYQSVASVRIYPDKNSLIYGLPLEPMQHNKLLKELCYAVEYGTEHNLIGGYSPGFGRYTFEKNNFSPKTTSVYGKILILEDICFTNEYNKRFITEHFIKIMLKHFKLLGLFNWVIVNPNIQENYIKEHNYPAAKSIETYKKFWESFKFERSYGKLHNDDYCYVLKVD